MKILEELKDNFNSVDEWFFGVGTVYYRKDLYNLLVDCRASLKKKDCLSTYLNLPRVERFAINLCVDKPSKYTRVFESEARKLVGCAFDENYDDAIKGLEVMAKNPAVINNLGSMVYEPADPVTLNYLYPQYIIDFCNKIKPQINNDTIMISLAQGAFRAGTCLTNSLNIEHLPIRLSMHKSRDTEPRIEKEYFLEQIKDKKLFVFDEDCATGITLYTFNEFLKEQGLKADFGAISTTSQPEYFKPQNYLIEVNI